MNIIVCAKQVPDTLEVNVDKETNTLIREGVDSVINPFDLNAIEEGLRLKERYGGSVTALSMGPPQAAEMLRETISLGVDHAVMLSDIAFAGADTLATAYTLAQAVRKIGPFDLILCGRQAVDGDTAHVGPELAEKLGIPHVSCVIKIGEVYDQELIIERMTDDGTERIKVLLPCLITVPRGINKPRFPTLKGKLTATRVDLDVWSAQDIGADPNKIGLDGSPTRVVRISTPEHDRGGEILEGTAEEQVAALLTKLQDAVVL